MREIPGLLFIILVAGYTFAAAQFAAPVQLYNKPFAAFDNYVKTEQKGMLGGDEKLATLFNAERIRLGNDFGTELVKYLGDDLEKHYWIPLYLTEKEYLPGNDPMPEFALRILQHAVNLIENEKAEDKMMNTVGIYVYAAILSKKLKQDAQAKKYKAKSESLSKKDEFMGTFPALSEEESNIYESIK